VVGLIQVLQEKNLQLRDKTNREGLIENDAFLDLKAVTRAAIRVFTSHWRKDRPRDESQKRKREGSIEAAKQVAGALKQTARDDIKVDLPPAIRPEDDGPRPGGSESEPPIELTTVTQREAVEILIDNIDNATATARETTQRLERLLSLAATGLAAERVVHEFGRQVAAATEALAGLRRVVRDSQDVRAFDLLDACLATLRSEFRILAPYETVGRPEKKRDVSAREIAELAITLNRGSLNQHKIIASVDGNDFQVRARAAALVQVVDNLVHNSCYWIGTLPSGRARRLSVLIDDSKKRLIVCDSGPGIAEEARDHLFEPFFSMKAGGTGLGLFISREILRRDSGDVAVANRHDIAGLPPWATGAVFIVQASATGKKAG
jgi:C4-dicarboxylate-specific signal transduction histidine kinase